MKSSNKRIYGETFSLLRDIKGYVPRLKRKIYLAYVENGVDFFTGKKLKIFTDKGLIYSLNNEEEKKKRVYFKLLSKFIKLSGSFRSLFIFS
ncbi:MAG: hypothetical protein RCG16_01005 [Rickettsia hoogstraalii]